MGAIQQNGKCYTYILKGVNDFYYCGITSKIDERYRQHNTGQSKSTKRNLPYSIKFLRAYPSRIEARRMEVRIKNTGVKKWYHKNILYGNHSNMVCTELIGGTKS